MFTLEINGTALVVTNADEEQARELLESEEFKDDLRTLTADGQPLWDGQAALNVRTATKDEEEAFEEALADEDFEDEDEDEADDDEEPIDIVFLVEVDEVDEEDEDDTASA